MKKGLSILLIAAALFGFYGGAVSLNDVLACKDYWEEQGEKSTADMNRLEDGLNQLKDNEQAYLDGIADYADGVEALAEGEAAYAEGQATLAQGEADYAAAPGKLAAGEKKLAAGKAKLAAGYAQRNAGQKTLASAIASRDLLNQTKQKIDKVESAYSPWLQKFGKLRNSIVDNPENPSKGVLYDAGATAVGLATVNDGFDTVKTTGQKGVDSIETGVKNNIIAKVKAQMPEGTTDKAAKAYAETNGMLTDEKVQEAIETSAYANEYKKAQGAIQLAEYLKATYSKDLLTTAGSINADIESIKGETYQATALRNSNLNSYASSAESLLEKIISDPMVKANAESLAQLIGGVNQVKGLASDSKNSTSAYNKDYDELKPNATMGNNIGSAVASASKAILSTPDIADRLTAAQREALKPFMSSGAITGLSNIELLYGTMTLGRDMQDDGKNSLLDSLRTINTAAASGLKQYNDGISAGETSLAQADRQLEAGEAELAKGKAELAKGYADYKAAPAKLAAGRAQLAEGLQAIMDGRAALAAGREKLDEYEDGEQQVRDGLATLMGTEAQGGLTSILDRRNGDDQFDDANGHLGLDEGLEAVATGREYQSDSGELITQEITKRAVGTAAGLAAGALAVLAAILSFLKKNKGAGASAILAAAAGGFGVAYGTSAGLEFSSIAGSTVGATPWIAAGILAGVALVHAITHFASKEA